MLFQTSGDSITVPVAVTVGSSVFVQVNPLSFTTPFGGANPLTQILMIDTTDNSAIGFTPVAATSNGGNWLSVSPNNLDCCNTPHAIAISVTVGTLAAGAYTGEVTIFQYSNPSMSMTIPVTLNVEPSSQAFFADLPGALSFSMKTNASAVSSQVVQIAGVGSGSLNWTVTPTTADTSPWLTVSSTSGTAPSAVTIGVNTSLLPSGGAVAGTYLGQLLFQTSGDTTTIPVWVTVGSPVFEQVNAIKFTMPFGGTNPAPQILTLETTDNSAIGFTPVAYTATGGNWLSVSPNNLDCCNTPHAVTVSVNASTLAAGTYTGEVTIYEYSNPELAINVPVTLTIESAGAFFNSLPGGLSFSLATGSTTATSQILEIAPAGTGTLKWTATAFTSDPGNWLTVTPSGTAPTLVTVGVNATQLPGGGAIAGTYLGELLFESGSDISSIPVSVTVGTAAFTQVNPISFTMPFGGANPLPQILTVETVNNSQVGFTAVASAAGNWLSVSPNNLDCCNTPHPVTVSVNAGTLAAGTYQGEVTIYQYSNPAMSMNVPVTLTIEASGAFLANSAGGLSFSMQKGATAVTSQSLQIGDGGSGKLKFSVSPSTADGGAWLAASPASGSAPKAVTVSVKPANLPGQGQIAGTYVGQLLLESGTDTSSVPVTVTVGDGVFVQENPLNFVMPVGGANPLPQILTVATNDASVRLGFTPVSSTATGGAWLSVSPNNLDCCNTPFPVSVFVNGSGLAAGTYTGEVTIYEYSNPELSENVPVTLTVVASSKAFFDNTPGQTSFSLTPGGANPPSQTIQIGNGGAGTLAWKAATNTADDDKWLSVTPTKGSNQGTYTVKVNAKSLPGGGAIAGTFLGQEVLSAKTGNVTIPVVVTVGNPVFVQVPTLTFATKQGTNPAPQTIAIDSSGNAMGFTPYARSGKGGNWLSVSPNNLDCCNTPSNITVSVNATSLAAGTYYGDINIIQYANPADSMTIPVVLTVSP